MTIVTFAQLAIVSLIPFSCELAVDHFREIEAIIAFNVIMFLSGLISVTLSLMIAVSNERDPSFDGSHYFRRRARLQLRIYAFVIVIALVGALIHRPFLDILLWGLCPLIIWYFLKDASGYPLVRQSDKVD